MTNGNHLAYPTFDQSGICPSGSDAGLSKREYFAAMALQGIISAHNIYTDGIDNEINAKTAVKASDALIKALNENN